MELQDIMGPRVTVPQDQKPGFWRRQFAASTTRAQLYFDILFGIVGPVLCFVFDPVVFHGWIIRPGLFSDYQTFVYLFSAAQITLLCLWLLTRGSTPFWNELVAGVLLAGGLFCLVLGIVLAPFSLMGLAFGVGVFGFTPFATAFVYFRNGSRALRARHPDINVLARAAASISGALLVAGGPLLLSMQIHSAVDHAVEDIVHGDTQRAIFAAHRLAPLHYVAEAPIDKIVNAYRSEGSQQRKELLKSCYREITGENIDDRVVILDD